MGVQYSHLRAENAALKEEVRMLKLQLLEAHRAHHAAVPEFSGFGRPTHAQIKRERQMSLGHLPILQRAEKITEGVLSLASAFDRFDTDKGGGIDVKELKAALEFLGVPVSSTQATKILQQYDNYPDNSIDVKEFATIVRDIKLLVEFDENKDGVLDAKELLSALESLGLRINLEQVERILKRFDVDDSGTIDLAELGAIVTTVKTFQRYDTDSSGSIDMEELRNALRKLGLRAGALEAGNILRRYDADESGTIDLCEFAVLVRDLQLYAEFDGDCNGAIDAQELYEAFGKLGLKFSQEEVSKVMHAWDPSSVEERGGLDMPSFTTLIGAVRIFNDVDRDGDGKIDGAAAREAMRELGVEAGGVSRSFKKMEESRSGTSVITLPAFAALVHDATNGVMGANLSSGLDGVKLDTAPESSFHAKPKLTGSGVEEQDEREYRQGTRSVLAQAGPSESRASPQPPGSSKLTA